VFFRPYEPLHKQYFVFRIFLQKYEDYLKQFLAYREQNQLISAYIKTPDNDSSALAENAARLKTYISDPTTVMPDLTKVSIYPLNNQTPLGITLKNVQTTETFDEPGNQEKKKAFFNEIRKYRLRWGTFENYLPLSAC